MLYSALINKCELQVSAFNYHEQHINDVVDDVLQVRVNIANGDMIGHTGNLEATILGCTTTDKAIKVASLALMIKPSRGCYIKVADTSITKN